MHIILSAFNALIEFLGFNFNVFQPEQYDETKLNM